MKCRRFVSLGALAGVFSAVLSLGVTADAQPNLVIAEPKDGQVYAAPADILIRTTAFDPAGAILYVEYFDGEQVIGHSQIATFAVPQPGQLWHHSFLWQGAPIGFHSLTARAHDSRGNPVISKPVQIQVVDKPLLPVVTVTATDPEAAEQDPVLDVMPNTATFRVARLGAINQPLSVYYRLGGTAENGVDYDKLPGFVTIPAGEASAAVVVRAIDDKLVEGPEKVILMLEPPPMMIMVFPPPEPPYLLGTPARAEAVILDNDASPVSQAKLVITKPQDGRIFIAPADVEIKATAVDPNGYINRVEFYDGEQMIGESAIIFDTVKDPDPGTPIYHSFLWENAPVGFHSLTARAVDSQHAEVKSDPVLIEMTETIVPTVVTVTAPDPEAWERNPLTKIMDNPGVFQLTRKGYTERALNVFYRLSGTAQNGVDYEKLPGWVSIPAGAISAEIVVRALDDLLVEGPETVVLTLTGPPLTGIEPTLDYYEAGDPHEAVVSILDNDASPDPPPTIVITQPNNGQMFVAPADIEIKVTAIDPKGFFYSIDFYAGDDKLGVSAIWTFVAPAPGTPAYRSFVWKNAPVGTYSLTARSIDSQGASVKSEPVNITVLKAEGPPETAKIVITQPKDGQVFVAPTDIMIKVSTVDPGWDYISSVELFVGEHKIGETGVFFYTAPPPGIPIDLAFLWKNVPVGSHALTAKSVDGAVKSSPVNITVLKSQEPPLATIVTVTAPDPEAAEANPVLSSVQPDTATFRVTRTGSTDLPLTVHYKLSGEAINEVDYLPLPEEVTIAQGESSADIGLLAVEDNLVEGTETVVLTLEDPACAAVVPPPPGCYAVGEPSQAVVVIRDKDTGADLPPKVLITHPHGDQIFAAPADIKIAAEARDPDGWVGKTEFFANGTKIGEVIVNFVQAPPPGETQAFIFSWSNVPAGEYVLTAVGTDDHGVTGKSNPITIKVTDAQHLPIVTVYATDPFAAEPGLNTATFKVHRTGPPSEPLTVRYSLGGTAENGVDYETLDGLVTIPAGRQSARIIVKPINDGQPELAETVAIKLEPEGLSPLAVLPRYEVGRPAKAVAVIVDDDLPWPKVTAFSEAVHLRLPGANGSTYRVEASDDLKTWVPVFSGVVTDGAVHFTDPDSADFNHRFYRVAPEIAPVPEDD